jgi:hypothetical protein
MSRRKRPITHEQKVGFCARSDITLDGQPARIIGARQDFGKVILRATGLGAEWSWETIASVCADDGAFRS